MSYTGAAVLDDGSDGSDASTTYTADEEKGVGDVETQQMVTNDLETGVVSSVVTALRECPS